MQPLANSLYQVSWAAPDDNGAEIDRYELEVESEARRARRDAAGTDGDEPGWRRVYSGAGRRPTRRRRRDRAGHRVER